MAPIRVKWDPEVLAAGFRPSSIFDEAEASNITASTITAPVDVVGAQSTAAAAHPAHNVTGVLNALVRETVRQVVAITTNTTTPAFITTTTTTTAPGIVTSTAIFQREVDHVTRRPEVGMVQVIIIFIVSMILVYTGQRYRNNNFLCPF